MATMTTAADQFTDAILTTWDSRDPYEATAARGLSETDAAALHDLCAETGEDYAAAEAEVLAFVRARLAR